MKLLSAAPVVKLAKTFTTPYDNAIAKTGLSGHAEIGHAAWFEGSGFEVLLAHLGRKAPLPSERATNIPECIDKLCAILMAKKPDQRPQTADDLVALIDQALAELAGKPKSKAIAAARPARKTKPPVPRTLVTLNDLPDGTILPRHLPRPCSST